MFGVLLKKQLREKFSPFSGARRDVAGAVLSVILTAALIAVSVAVLIRLAEVYVDIRINGVRDVRARMTELMTVIYAVIFVLGVFSGVRNINFELFESEDRAIFMALPIKSGTVFYSKLVVLYLKQIVLFALTVIPVNMALLAHTEPTPLYIGATIGACFIFPALTLVFSSIFCFPVFMIKRLLRSGYLVTLLLTTGVMAALFFGYRYVLEFIRQLFTTGEIRFFFNESVMNGMMTFTEYAYPVNFLARLVMNTDPARNGAMLGVTALIALAAGFAVVSLLYNKVNLMRATQIRHTRRSARVRFAHRKNIVLGLMGKEFFLIYRTPSYAFQYFSVAITMPLMVYFCMGIGVDLLRQLVMIDASAELGLFLVLAFGALTNTFAATNISRDGSAFYTLKAMPIKPRSIINAKVIFSSVIAVFSVLVSALVLYFADFAKLSEAAFIFLIGAMMGEAQIAFATRKDLNRPEFSSDDDSEVRESTGTVSLIIIIGFLTGLVTGGLALFMSIYFAGRGVAAETYIRLACFALAAALMALAFTYLYKGLDKRLYEMSEGGK